MTRRSIGTDWKITPISPSPEDELYNKSFDFWNNLIAKSFMIPVGPMILLQNLFLKYPKAQFNDEGQIAVKYRQPGNVLLTGNPSGKEYVAVTQANICMAWVDPADVDFILAKKDGCCGGKRQSFFLANESDVRRWTNKGGQ